MDKIDYFYCIMDGRANYDTDRALVNEICKSLDEAIKNINDYGADSCIVKMYRDDRPDELIWSLLWGEYLQ